MDPLRLICFDRRHKILLAILAVMFVSAVSMRIHGWSLPYWHHWIDNSAADEIIEGRAEGIRGDDFVIEIPIILSQVLHRPSFPRINTTLGTGLNAVVPMRVPSLHSVSMLFRPTTWGFLIGADVGLAWMWWTLTLGIFYTSFLCFMFFSKNNFWISTLAAFTFVASPFVQFWSMHKGEIICHAFLAIVTGAYLLFSQRRSVIWMASGFLGWTLTGLVIDFMYPPFLVSVCYLLLFLAVGTLLDHRKIIRHLNFRLERLFAFFLCCAGAAVAIGAFFWESHSAIEAIHGTFYPGARFLQGGTWPVWAILNSTLFARMSGTHWQGVGNICEASSFVLFFPLLILLSKERWKDKSHQWTVDLILLYLIFLVVYAVWGIPVWFAKYSLFSKVLSQRIVMSLGMGDAILIVGLSAKIARGEMLPRSTAIRASLLWSCLLLVSGLLLMRVWPEFKIWHLLFGVLVHFMLAVALLVGGMTRTFWATLAIISILITMRFNPIVKGGTNYITNNPLSQRIRQIDEEEHGQSKWVVYGDLEMENLFRMIGVHTLGGYHPQPDFSLWSHFDPAGRLREKVYNQCAHVLFQYSESTQPEVYLAWEFGGAIGVKVNPAAPIFRELGVRYFLVHHSLRSQIERTNKLVPIFSYGNYIIYTLEGSPNQSASS